MAVPSPSPDAKRDLRGEGLRLRREFARGLTPAARAGLEAALARIVLPHLAGANMIAAYDPLPDEISPAAITAGRRVALPWFADRAAAMGWREGPATAMGPWGVAQPADDAAVLVPDVVLVPLVLADRSGGRIGRGKGHYDRALADLGAVAIGLAWDIQLSDTALPCDSWDARLDAIATPSEWIQCG
jgi:5-formyltetrahydrofolate cyclo-ligase